VPALTPIPETAYEECTYTREADYTGCQGSGVRGACYYNSGSEAEEKVACYNNVRALRHCSYAGAQTQCGTAGPNGCAVCWSQSDYYWSALCSDNVCVWTG